MRSDLFLSFLLHHWQVQRKYGNPIIFAVWRKKAVLHLACRISPLDRLSGATAHATRAFQVAHARRGTGPGLGEQGPAEEPGTVPNTGRVPRGTVSFSMRTFRTPRISIREKSEARRKCVLTAADYTCFSVTTVAPSVPIRLAWPAYDRLGTFDNPEGEFRTSSARGQAARRCRAPAPAGRRLAAESRADEPGRATRPGAPGNGSRGARRGRPFLLAAAPEGDRPRAGAGIHGPALARGTGDADPRAD